MASTATTVFTRAQLIAKARTLPPSLLTFFTRFPTPAIGPRVVAPISSDLPPPPANFIIPDLPTDPFSPWTNPLTSTATTAPTGAPGIGAGTGRRGPFYGRRAQASIAKLARQHGVEELLPNTTPKKTGVRETRRIVDNGMRARLRGNAVSSVKGHKWERTLESRMDVRKTAMLGMNKMVEEWKHLGYGRGWKTWPKRAGKK